MKTVAVMKELLSRRSTIAVWVIVIAVLFVVSRYNYLLYHTVAESFSVLVAVLVYVMATRTYKYSKNVFLLFLGYAYSFIAVLNFFHLITYYGMGIFPNDDPNIPTQFWIADRYLEAISLFIAATFIQKEFPRRPVLVVYGGGTAALIASILWLKIFPLCFIEGVGLTTFKVTSEYVVSMLMLGAIAHLYIRREKLGRTLYLLISGAIAMAILSELVFTLYTDVYGFTNFVGHIFEIVSNYLILWGIILHGLEAPYDMIFTELKASATTDSLTGLYNRHGFIEATKKEMTKAGTEGYSLSLLLIDIDKFKKVNDRYGHMVGDQVLKHFAGILLDNVRADGLVCRLGGDEFVILVNTSKMNPELLNKQLREAVRLWSAANQAVREIGISIGSVEWKPGYPENILGLLDEADQKMYQEKRKKEISGFRY